MIINELANAVVLLKSNLIVKWFWMFENRVFQANEALGGIIDFISWEQNQGSIYKKGKSGDDFTIDQGIERAS